MFAIRHKIAEDAVNALGMLRGTCRESGIGSISYLIADNGQELPVFVGSGSSHVGDVTEEVSFRAELGSSMAGLPGSRDKLMQDSSG